MTLCTMYAAVVLAALVGNQAPDLDESSRRDRDELAPLAPDHIACDTRRGVLFGVIADVGIDGRDRALLLDQQLHTVHVVNSNGDSETIEQHGRSGEGPGEFWNPQLLGVGSDGGFTVFQSFHADAVSFGPEGDLATAPRLVKLRAGFLSTEFSRVAQVDSETFVLEVVHLQVVEDSPSASVVRELVLLRDGGDSVDILLSTAEERPALFEFAGSWQQIERIPAWDVDGSGRLIFFDGRSPGALTMISLADGSPQQLAIHPSDAVLAATVELERQNGIPAGRVPRYSEICWLEPGRSVVVRAEVEKHLEREGRQWIAVETHDLETGASSASRLAVLDSSEDLAALRSGHVIVVDGAKLSKARHWGHAEGSQSETGVDTDARANVSDEVCVRIFELPPPR